MEAIKMIHKISKGSRYNQIYIPKEKEGIFQAGDIVEIKLIRKASNLFYNNLKESELSSFKLRLIEEIFRNLSVFTNIEQVFIFGSFLTKKTDYNDIDILILAKKDSLEEKVHEILTKEFNLKFHVISVNKDKLVELLKICPLTRSMLYYFVSNKSFEVPKETKIDEKHLRFLLMMPEDLLKFGLEQGKIYYDTLRKLIVIESFLKKSEIAPDKTNEKLEKLINIDKLDFIRNNGSVKGAIKSEIEKIIRNKLNIIDNYLKNVKKR